MKEPETERLGSLRITETAKFTCSSGRRVRRFLLLTFVVCSLLICHGAFATAKTSYDGIWFLGFNLNKPLLAQPTARQAVNAAIDVKFIAEKLVSSEVVPSSLIPPGLLGYDPDLQPTMHDAKTAKLLLKKAGLTINDPRLKNLTLLHTDGILTIEIARKIQSDLRAIGIKLTLVQVPYKDEKNWSKALVSGQNDFFLMGYKASFEQLLTEETTAAEPDSAGLLAPLFQSQGEANFTGYANPQVDQLFEQLEGINLALSNERHAKLKKINRKLVEDLPAVVLFYIEKL
ncbi:hypothetical protein HZB07_02985 [Candidatus Saganbacteria bacterium]|nr:hypothetical protein [Candidatus Saganbacteria bacterium]